MDLRKKLGLPSNINPDEVWNALDATRWRTGNFIADLIHQSRVSSGDLGGLDGTGFLKIIGSVRLSLYPVLRGMTESGMVHRKIETDLTLEEIDTSDDPRISNPVEMTRIRKRNGGRLTYAYRRGNGTRVRDQSLEGGSILMDGGKLITT